MKFARLLWSLGTLLVVLSVQVSQGDETPAQSAKPQAAQPESAKPEVTKSQIAKWVEDLDAEQFPVREQATRRLFEAAPQAMDAIAAAAASESREASSRAFEILRRSLAGDDAKLQAKAKAALEKLASSESEQTARLAKTALENAAQEQPQAAQRAPAAAVPLAPARIRVFGGAVGGRGIELKVVQATEVDGVKTVTVRDGDKEIEIEKNPDDGITVKVTEKVDGKEKTKAYQAKTAEELEKKHPEAHKLYKEYAEGDGGIRLHARAGVLRAGGARAAVKKPAGPAAAGARLKEAREHLELLKKALKELDQDNEAVRRLKQQLEAAAQKIDEAQRSLRGEDEAK